MRNKLEYSQHTHTYLALRKTVGWIGILLPFTLMLGNFFIFKGEITLHSISRFYHTDMRDVFVGALCVIALFLFFYSGYDKWDDWAGNIAGFFALGTVLFPTTEMGLSNAIGKIHFACAAFFFLTLAAFSLFLFTRKRSDSTPKKQVRYKIHIICGLIIVACVIAIALYYIFIHDVKSDSCFVFVAETVALVVFGVSWLIEGKTLDPDKENQNTVPNKK